MSGITGYSQNSMLKFNAMNLYAPGGSDSSESSGSIGGYQHMNTEALTTYNASDASGVYSVSNASGASDVSSVSNSSNWTQNVTFSANTLKQIYKFDDSSISKYFDRNSDGSYSIKKGGSYTNINDIKTAIAQDYQKQLIINNFLNDKNRRTDLASDMRKTDANTTISSTNYYQYAAQLALSPAQILEMQTQAVEKFVQDFSDGNLAYAQVRTVLNAIGVKNVKISTVDDMYEISFKFNGVDYHLYCNKGAAEKGTDDITTESINNDNVKAATLMDDDMWGNDWKTPDTQQPSIPADEPFTMSSFYKTELGQKAQKFLDNPSSFEYTELLTLNSELQVVMDNNEDTIAIEDQKQLQYIMNKVTSKALGNINLNKSYSSQANTLLESINNGNLDINKVNVLYDFRKWLNLDSEFVEVLEKLREANSKGSSYYRDFVNNCKNDYKCDNAWIGVVLEQISLGNDSNIYYKTLGQWTGEEEPSDAMELVDLYLDSKHKNFIAQLGRDYNELLPFFTDIANRYVEYSGKTGDYNRTETFFKSLDMQIELAKEAKENGEDIKDYIENNILNTPVRMGPRRAAATRSAVNEINNILGLPSSIDLTDNSESTRNALTEYYNSQPGYTVSCDDGKTTISFNEETLMSYNENYISIYQYNDGYVNYTYSINQWGSYIEPKDLTDNGQFWFDCIIRTGRFEGYPPMEYMNTSDIPQEVINYIKDGIENGSILDDMCNALKKCEYDIGNLLDSILKITGTNTGNLFNSIIDHWGANDIILESAYNGYLVNIDTQNMADMLIRLKNRNSSGDINIGLQSIYNDNIGNFSQNKIGDCWFLSSIKALDSADLGHEFLTNIVDFDPTTQSFSVTIQGKNFSYPLSSIVKMHEGVDDNYIIRAFERAAIDFLKSNPLNNGKSCLTAGGFTYFAEIFCGTSDFVSKIDTSDNNLSSFLSKIGNDYFAVAYSRNKSIDGLISYHGSTFKDSVTGKEYELIGSHAYSVICFDGENVELANPWNSKEIITISFNDFKRLFGSVEQCSISMFVRKAQEQNGRTTSANSDSPLNNEQGADEYSHYTGKTVVHPMTEDGRYLWDLSSEELEEYGYQEEYIGGYRFIKDKKTGKVVDGEVTIQWEDGCGHFVDKDGNDVVITVKAEGKRTGGSSDGRTLLDYTPQELKELGYTLKYINGYGFVFDKDGNVIESDKDLYKDASDEFKAQMDTWIRGEKYNVMLNTLAQMLEANGTDGKAARQIVELLMPSKEDCMSVNEDYVKDAYADAVNSMKEAIDAGITFNIYDDGRLSMVMPDLYKDEFMERSNEHYETVASAFSYESWEDMQGVDKAAIRLFDMAYEDEQHRKENSEKARGALAAALNVIKQMFYPGSNKIDYSK